VRHIDQENRKTLIIVYAITTPMSITRDRLVYLLTAKKRAIVKEPNSRFGKVDGRKVEQLQGEDFYSGSRNFLQLIV
jgi:hypothetical protein